MFFRSLVRRFLGWRLNPLLVLLYMLGIFALSSAPGVIPDDAAVPYQIFNRVPPVIQNLLHIPVYAGLAFLWRWCLDSRLSSRMAMVSALAITVGYGVFDEWYQSFVPGRFSSTTDVTFNSIGACLGLLVFWYLDRWSRRVDRLRADRARLAQRRTSVCSERAGG